jgi:hypothetical protein
MVKKMTENEIKRRVLSMIEEEARKRLVEFRMMYKGRSYQFSVGNVQGIVKYTNARGTFWVGIMQETIRELGDKAFLIEIDQYMNKYIVIPFGEIKNWNPHANKPLVSATFRRVGGGYVIQPTDYRPVHIAHIGSPEALHVIFPT